MGARYLAASQKNKLQPLNHYPLRKDKTMNAATLIVKCPEHLQAVRDFADRTNQRTQFEEKLESLSHWFAQEGWTI
jgi:hypothetical protein